MAFLPQDQALQCGTCQSGSLETVLRLGSQPVSSHYTRAPHAPVVERDLTLSVCPACGVMQLQPPFPFRDLVPPFDWITYREPEEHLDHVAGRIRALPGLNQDSRISGLSFKDRTLIERLSGFPHRRTLDPYRDLGADYPNANIESVAGLLTLDLARRLGHSSPSDVVIARHILEHSSPCRLFLEALKALMTPDGYLVLEVPDCNGNLARQDCTMIWEEHSYYFTPETLPGILTCAGFSVLGLDVHPYPFEDVVVVYARKRPQTAVSANSLEPDTLARHLDTARAFGAAHADWRRRYVELFGKLTAEGRKLAAYGAGHLTCAFLNFYDVAAYFEFVVDDTPQKQNLFLPKSGIPIVSRERLGADHIAACLFGLSPHAEDKVISNNQTYLNAGGKFFSMFADSKRSIRGLM